MKKQIPNFITLLNLLSGCIAVVFAVLGRLEIAAFFVCLGIFFDFFDGLAARVLNVKSALGLQLDSLADMVTSGVVPGIVMFQMLNKAVLGDFWGVSVAETETMIFESMHLAPLAFLGFLITLASAYRLANFNIDANQTDSFVGLPTPANALFILSFPLIAAQSPEGWLAHLLQNTWVLVGLTLLSAYLLNAPIKLFALKFKTWGFRENAFRYLFLLASVLLLLGLKVTALPIIIVLYVLVSVGMGLVKPSERDSA